MNIHKNFFTFSFRYLDQYYSKYNQRVQKSQVDKLNKRGGPQVIYVTKNRQSPSEYDLIAAAASQSQAIAAEEASERRSSALDQMPYDMEDNSQYTEMIEQTASPGTRYVQHVSLPRQMPDDSTYMYSAVHPSEMEENEVMDTPPRKIMPGSLYDGMKVAHYSNAMDQLGYEEASRLSQTGQKIVYLTEPREQEHAMEATSKSDYFESEPYVERDTSYSSSEGRPGLGKFFGLTGTTSQNIQVNYASKKINEHSCIL